MKDYEVVKRQIFHFDSSSRAAGNINNPQFFFKKELFATSDPKSILRFSLIQATVPYTWNNINNGALNGYTNNYMKVSNNGVISLITVPAGNYNISQLANSIITQLNIATGITFSYSFNSINLGLTFTYTGSNSISFIFENSLGESLARPLGFNLGTFNFSGNSLTSINPVNVSESSDVFLNITNVQPQSYEYLNGELNVSNLFCTLPINSAFYNNIIYESRIKNNFNMIIPAIQMPDNFVFQVVNQNGTLLPLNRDWNVTLECEWMIRRDTAKESLLEKITLITYKIAEDLEHLKQARNKDFNLSKS